MGVQDRDWWRKRKDNLYPDDPRSWPVGDQRPRKAKAPRTPQTGSYNSSPSWLVIVIVAMVVFGSLYLFDRYRPVITGALKTSTAAHWHLSA